MNAPENINKQLIEAAIHGHTDAVITLLGRGADIEAKSDNGWTPLMIATIKGHADILIALLKAGADVEAINNTGWTPLLCAAMKGYVGIVMALLEHDADVTAKNDYGLTAADYASKYQHQSISDLLNSWDEKKVLSMIIKIESTHPENGFNF